jgi:hypothetical protein
MTTIGDIGFGVVLGVILSFLFVAWMADREDRAKEEMDRAAQESMAAFVKAIRAGENPKATQKGKRNGS